MELNRSDINLIQGQPDLKNNWNKINCLIGQNSSSQDIEVHNGDVVKLVAGSEFLPTVSLVEATETDQTLANTMLGVVELNNIKNEHETDEVVVVSFFGNVIALKAGVNLSCGEKVAYDVTNKYLVKAASAGAGIVLIGNALTDIKANTVGKIMIK